MDTILHIYTRVSSSVQEEEGTSLDNQKNHGIKKAEELGMPFKVWNEGGQSSFHDDLDNRPVLVSLLGEIEEGSIKNLFVYNTDRLSRNQKTWGMIRYKLLSSGVTLHTVSGKMELKNPIDDLLLGILSEISQYDNKIRSERSRQGRFQKIQMGNWRGGPPPFGYINLNKKLEINEEESHWVKKMFEWYNKGIPVIEIKSRLDSAGVLTRRQSGLWSLPSIRLILRNTVYVGHYNYTDKMIGETVRIETPQIIDTMTYDLAQRNRKIASITKQSNNPTKRFYLLRGILECGHCGRKMSGRINKKAFQSLYYCPKHEREWLKGENESKWDRSKSCGLKRSINIDRTDKFIWETVLEVVSKSYVAKEEYRQEIIGKVIADKTDSSTSIRSNKTKLKRLQRDLDKIDNTISIFETNVLLKKQSGNPALIRNNLNGERENLINQINDTKDELDSLAGEKIWIDWVTSFDQNITKKSKLSPEEKQNYLQSILEKIVVNYNIEKASHSIDIFFRIPLVDDRIAYVNPEKKSEGRMILEGKKSLLVEGLILNGNDSVKSKKE